MGCRCDIIVQTRRAVGAHLFFLVGELQDGTPVAPPDTHTNAAPAVHHVGTTSTTIAETGRSTPDEHHTGTTANAETGTPFVPLLLAGCTTIQVVIEHPANATHAEQTEHVQGTAARAHSDVLAMAARAARDTRALRHFDLVGERVRVYGTVQQHQGVPEILAAHVTLMRPIVYPVDVDPVHASEAHIITLLPFFNMLPKIEIERCFASRPAMQVAGSKT